VRHGRPSSVNAISRRSRPPTAARGPARHAVETVRRALDVRCVRVERDGESLVAAAAAGTPCSASEPPAAEGFPRRGRDAPRRGAVRGIPDARAPARRRSRRPVRCRTPGRHAGRCLREEAVCVSPRARRGLRARPGGNARFVVGPRTAVSASAARSRASADARSGPQAEILLSSGRYSTGTTAPAAIPESTRMPARPARAARGSGRRSGRSSPRDPRRRRAPRSR
jgi:hypothetical protein